MSGLAGPGIKILSQMQAFGDFIELFDISSPNFLFFKFFWVCSLHTSAGLCI